MTLDWKQDGLSANRRPQPVWLGPGEPACWSKFISLLPSRCAQLGRPFKFVFFETHCCIGHLGDYAEEDDSTWPYTLYRRPD